MQTDNWKAATQLQKMAKSKNEMLNKTCTINTKMELLLSQKECFKCFKCSTTSTRKFFY